MTALTAREVEVLALIADGHSLISAGREIFISPDTVRFHTLNAQAKLGARTRTHAIAIAIRTGVITGPDEVTRYERKLEDLALQLSQLAAEVATLPRSTN